MCPRRSPNLNFWENAKLSSKGVSAKRQNYTSFGSAETKNNKCTTRQPVNSQHNELEAKFFFRREHPLKLIARRFMDHYMIRHVAKM
ncbi:unnamed protein product [Camellia sinensis]